MKRFALDKLVEWKNNPNKKPLILNGARQVGKTWLMKELGEKYYKDYIYINFDKNPVLYNVFEENLDPKRIINQFIKIFNRQITEETLVIFDEIQEIPKALSSLKYFQEETKYNIICAGSLLGIAFHKGVSYPVGKVQNINIYPMNFCEFLLGTERKNLYDILLTDNFSLIKIMKNQFIEALKEYYIVGGMPGVVNIFSETKSFSDVQRLQNDILDNYEKDFSKHTDKGLSLKIIDVWHSVIGQLSKENKKFQYSSIRQGSRSSDYEYAIMWLKDCGLIKKINKISSYKIPIEPYKERNLFKIYLNDIGLLCNMAKISSKTIFLGNNIFVEFKGALTEQFVCQELCSLEKINLGYYSKGQCEIDFVGDYENTVFPIEVKANINLRAKSLKSFTDKYNPPFAVRTSLADYNKTEKLIDIPLYAISEIINIIENKN